MQYLPSISIGHFMENLQFCSLHINHYKALLLGVPFVPQQLMNLTRVHVDASSIPGLTQWVKDLALW